MPSESTPSKYVPNERVMELFRQLGAVEGCILTHKNDALRAVNAIGAPCLWRIDRTDLGVDEYVVSTREACVGIAPAKEPPFHVHMIDWTDADRANWTTAKLDFHPNHKQRLALDAADGRELIAWFVPAGDAADALASWLESNQRSLR